MPNNEHILVVEDEQHLATGIKYNLVAEGYRVTTVGDGPSALRILQEKPILLSIKQRGQRLMDGLREIFEENNYPVVMSGYPAMFSFAMEIEKVTCQRDWNESNHALYLQLAEMAMERGIMPDHDAREPWFLCYEHSDADIDETLNVYADIVKQVKRH